MSRKIILIKQELLLLVYELNRSGLLAENEKIRKQAVVIQIGERFSRNAETDLVCRLLLEKKKSVMSNAEEQRSQKPEPEGYLRAASRHGRSPDECIVLEDAPPVLEASHAAGRDQIGRATQY